MVAVTVLSAPEVPDLEGMTFFCRTEDLSINGLRLHVHTHVPLGAMLDMRVAFKDPLRSFKLSGLVAWGRLIDRTSAVELGIEFGDVPLVTLEPWKEIVAKKLAEHVFETESKPATPP
jgi:hypothetical protein